MKKQFFYAAMAIALASCASDDFVGENNNSPNSEKASNAIMFTSGVNATTRAGEFIGATAADMLGGMFVVEGTKGSEQTNSPSTDVVFDNYLVGYEYNSAGKTESNTNNWEYVGKQTGITNRMESTTWTALHGSGTAQVQSIKYWDFSQPQYDFIAWSTGTLKAVTTAPVSGTSVQVTRIATGTDLSSTTAPGAFTLTAASADDLLQCYYTDINTVLPANYGQPVTLTFRNMAAKVRVALYETVPGYSVKDVLFYTDEATSLGLTSSDETKKATLYTPSGDENKLPQSGQVLVYYPRIGTSNNTKADYKKASVIVTSGSEKSPTQKFGTLTAQYRDEEGYEPDGKYLGTTLPTATYAGDKTKNYYTAVIPNTDGKPLTLRVDYTLVSTDGSGEEIKVYGAKAVVPSTYTKWMSNYAYTYIFKISDNTNGWTTSTGATDLNQGLYPITFDAVVTSFTDANAEQTTITTVASRSITTYQQGHDPKTQDEYVNNGNKLYVQVMDNSTTTPTLVTDLKGTGATEGKKSRLYAIGGTAPISEATVMDALQNRTTTYNADNIAGRNGMTLTKNDNINNSVTQIVNGVDNQPIGVTSGTAAEIAITSLAEGYYAYVYASTVPTAEEKIYHVVSYTAVDADPSKYYEIVLDPAASPEVSGTADADYVYFVKNLKADGTFDSYTFKQTKVGVDDVTGLVKAAIGDKASAAHVDGHFYFDVYNQNNGAYAVKVIKVVEP